MRNSRDWLIALAGVVFFVLAVGGFIVGGEPPDPTDEPLQEVVDFYVDNEGRLIAGVIMVTIALTFLVLFASYLRTVLRAAEERGILSTAAFAGAVIIAIGGALDSTITFALVEAADEDKRAAVESLSMLWNNDFVPFALGTQLLMLGSGLSILIHGSLPKWLGWIAILLALIAVTPIGFAAFIGMGLWVLVTSVLLTLRARGGTATTA